MSQLAVPHQPQQPRELTEVKNRANAFFKPRKKSLTSGFSLNSAAHPNSHIIMTNNAMFLLGNFFRSRLCTFFQNIYKNKIPIFYKRINKFYWVYYLDLSSASNPNLMNTTSAAAPTAFNNMSSSSYSKKLMTTSIGGLSAVSELESMDPNPFPLVPFQVCSIHYLYYIQNFVKSVSRNFFVKISLFSVSTNWESVIVIFDSSTTNLSWMRF